MTQAELVSKVRELKELQKMAQELEQEIEKAVDIIKAEMAERDTEVMDVDVYTVRWSTVESSRFDSAAFKATHEELYRQYCKPVQTRRFTVT